MFRPRIRSRHPSHNILRGRLQKLPVTSVVRLGSTTQVPGVQVEINSVASIGISGNKLRMKQAFNRAGVSTAPWVHAQSLSEVQRLLTENAIEFPIVAKSFNGSRGRGNTLLHSANELVQFAGSHTVSNYIFEKYFNYGLEYRLHISRNGCFYTCRKALKADTPTSEKWRRHKDNSVWLLETNPEFRKPSSWDRIVADCQRALQEVGADVLSFDVRVQSATDNKGRARQDQNWILIECNSASSMDSGSDEISICAQRYLEELPRLILQKAGRV